MDHLYLEQKKEPKILMSLVQDVYFYKGMSNEKL